MHAPKITGKVSETYFMPLRVQKGSSPRRQEILFPAYSLLLSVFISWSLRKVPLWRLSPLFDSPSIQ